jgi:hypothetical protein
MDVRRAGRPWIVQAVPTTVRLELQPGPSATAARTCRSAAPDPTVSAGCTDCTARQPIDCQAGMARLLVVLRLDNLAATIKAVRAHVVATMNLAGRRLGSQRGGGEKIVRTVLAASRSRFLVLLDCHRNTRGKVKRAILQRIRPS